MLQKFTTTATPLRPLELGTYPTAVDRIDALSTPDCDLWVKRDDRSADGYGGNKVRKLEYLLAQAIERGARRVVTIGAAGSHHVLATTYFGQRVGLEVEAVLLPQPRSPHAVDVLRAGLGLGLRPFPVRSFGGVPFAVAARVARGAWFIPVGGSTVVGSMGYVKAAGELAGQIRNGTVPEPDFCVVALGSGGTAAGLAAGFEAAGLGTKVVGVTVASPSWALPRMARRLARACSARPDSVGAPASRGAIRARLTADARFLGRGYGWATPEGEEATRIAKDVANLVLDPTYTAKSFASALWYVRARRGRHILFWHTLSSAPMAPLLVHAPAENSLAKSLLGLLF